jgi:predicted transcriptional regulator
LARAVEAHPPSLLLFKDFVRTYKNIELYFYGTIHFLGEKMVLRVRESKRDRVAIIAEILEMARDGEFKSNIMWKAGLSYLMLNGYIKLMLVSGLLFESTLNNKIMFKTSKRGLKFLYHCNEIMYILKNEDAENKLYGRIRLLPSSLSV